MRSLYVRIWLTVVVAVAVFAVFSGWVVQRYLENERSRGDSMAQERLQERLSAWSDLLERSLPPASAARAEQAMAIRDWSVRLRVPLALDDVGGVRIGASDVFARRESEGAARPQSFKLDDGRTLWVMRPMAGRPGAGAGGAGPGPPWLLMRAMPGGLGLAILLALLFVGVAVGAWPVVRRLTRRLEALQQGVDAFGKGALSQRVAEDGRDEVATLAASFNRAATRIEALVRSHQSLLANASHELRSPLARLKMAISLAEDAAPAQRAALKREIQANIGELDALVEEVLLASRLDAAQVLDASDAVELLGIAAEEAARVNAQVQGHETQVRGDERLLRRALRNLLENARRYGGDEVEISVGAAAAGHEVRVSDRGPGVPEAFRERIFEPFFRLPGHAEREGGVGLGLSLVRQIAERHGGSIRCEPRTGGGSCFVLTLPGAA